MLIDYEPRFVEEAVLLAVGARPEGRLFYREREATYRVRDPEARGRDFDDLALRWFARLGLEALLVETLAEQPLIVKHVEHCAIGRALRRRDAGAELLVHDPAPGEPASAARLLRVLLAPAVLVDPGRARPFLRRELQHVADMVDPGFGYRPMLETAGGPGRQAAARERYRVLWNASVDGRLVTRGWLSASVRTHDLVDVRRVFPELDDDGTEVFERFFDDLHPTHAAIAAVATLPPGGRAGSACPLCGFPTPHLVRDAGTPEPAVARAITADFPNWQDADGCCGQCLELYRARDLSVAAAAALPGVR